MSIATYAHGHRGNPSPLRHLMLAACAAPLCLAAIAPGQVYVDGQSTGVVLQAQPVPRTYSQVYSAASRARLVTKQSVMNNGGTIAGAQAAIYLQPGYPQPQSVMRQPQAEYEEFRLNGYASRRYLNDNYRDYSYYSNRGWYGGSYWYEYAPGFYYAWWPSYGRFVFPYRVYKGYSSYGYGYSYHGYSVCRPFHYGGSSFRLSSHGLGIRVRF